MKKNIFLLPVSFVFLQLSQAQNVGVGNHLAQACILALASGQ
jgi:hypothetical protein